MRFVVRNKRPLKYSSTRKKTPTTAFIVMSFVIQGGNKTREKDNDPAIPLETPFKTGVKNTDGAISMARTQEPNSATSEFFICDGDQARLDGSDTQPGYAAFGHVTKNMSWCVRSRACPARDKC